MWRHGFAGAGVMAGAFLGVLTSAAPAAGCRSHGHVILCPSGRDGWPRVGSKPLSDRQAAALVRHRREVRPDNVAANDYVPTRAQLRAFHAALNDGGDRADVDVPERVYVTGRPGLRHPSTDDLIQWASYKWGIPTNWIRAEAIAESDWHQSGMGDRTTVPADWYALYPPQSRIAGTSDVYQSMGIMSVRWQPNGADDSGTEPLRWKSVAFNLDIYAATVRYYYDGFCNWCGAGYSAGQTWNSIGAWYNPSPWRNSGADAYIASVKHLLATRAWTHRGF
jgi:hypothetical protein